MFVRITAIRRLFYVSCLFIGICLVINQIRQYRTEPNAIVYKPGPDIDLYVDANGSFIHHMKYEILQFVEIPLQDRFNEFYNYVDQQTELKDYFTFVPQTAYHITLTTLKDEISENEEHIKTLIREQQTLDKDETFTLCLGKQVYNLEQKEIRIELEFQNNFLEQNITKYQKRWTNTFPDLIVEHRKTFYVTIAYQYKTIPSKEMFDQFNEIIQNWQDFTFEVYVEPIEICSYADLLLYKPIVPDDPTTVKPIPEEVDEEKNEKDER
ncbi:unnamed protein product [Adineta ricciae]|uniref:Uncharacterized protein n=1 Tax=Adineta ricciae TaxID=249248 RepID=A0A815HM92_ADIRI|nr:unnamed protein product [Adineta ricciae]